MFPTRKFLIREAARTMVKQIRGRSDHKKIGSTVIRVGDPLPCCDLYEDFPNNVIKMPNFVIGKNVVIIGVPGAFSPGCSKTHLPGYVKAADDMKKNGIHEIICISVNDAYVMGAWAKQQNTKTKIRMFADPAGSFISKCGLGVDLVSLGGFRAKRFSMVVVDKFVRVLNIEPDDVGLNCSLADVLCYKAAYEK